MAAWDVWTPLVGETVNLNDISEPYVFPDWDSGSWWDDDYGTFYDEQTDYGAASVEQYSPVPTSAGAGTPSSAVPTTDVIAGVMSTVKLSDIAVGDAKTVKISDTLTRTIIRTGQYSYEYLDWNPKTGSETSGTVSTKPAVTTSTGEVVSPPSLPTTATKITVDKGDNKSITFAKTSDGQYVYQEYDFDTGEAGQW